jgi:UDP-N-acetylmuramate: L-alanyl-gamma-D-glutamyl-meso-diaminopimelate ligase
MSLPAALAAIFLRSRRPVVVAGTHGKTTCAALISNALYQAGREPGFSVGGIPKNFGANFRVGGRQPGSLFVVEGDEYKTTATDLRPKFLHYRPHVLLCTSLEFDHANLYSDVEEIRTRFTELIDLVPQDGHIVCCAEEPNLTQAMAHSVSRAPAATYGHGGDWTALEVFEEPAGLHFRPTFRGEATPSPVRLGLHGRHNLLNGLGCYAILSALGLAHEEIAAGFTSFLGVERRMEVLGDEAGVRVIDDYAHHPTAVDVTLKAARVRYPDGPLWAVFEPRSTTSCQRVFQDEYACAFDAADRVFLAPVYRQVSPEERLDLPCLVRALRRRRLDATAFPTLDALIERISCEVEPGTTVICMSSGSFGGLPRRLLDSLQERCTSGARFARPGAEAWPPGARNRGRGSGSRPGV